MSPGRAGRPDDVTPSVTARRVQVSRCGLCQVPVPPGREQYAVLADSSVIDPRDPNMDGRRVVLACSDEHLAAIRAAAPQWCDEQLWAGRLARANEGRHRAPLPLAVLARRAGLRPDQAQRAVDWRQSRDLAGRPTDA